MPPKKYNTRSRAAKEAETAASASARSTAAIFQNVDADTLKPSDDSSKVAEPTAEVPQEEERDLELELAGFPYNIIYRVQDFLNEHLTYLQSFQLMVFTYIFELIYFNYTKLDKFEDNMQVIGFNFVGVILALLLNYIKGFAPGETKYPPEFNYLYSIILPFLFNIVYVNDDFFNVNLALNYFIVDRLHPFFTVFSSIAFYQIYSADTEKSSITTVNYIQICLIHFMINYGLNYINDGNLENEYEIIEIEVDDDEVDVEDEIIEVESHKSFSKAEIQLVSLIITNVLLNRQLVDPYLPLVIFQKLLISLLITTLVNYPIYLYLPNIVTAITYSASFYFLTDYQLQLIFNQNSIVWLYEYIFLNETRLNFLKFWSTLLVVLIPLIFTFSKYWSKNLRRKVWHFLIIVVLLFTPSILIDQIEFTLISLLGVIIIFVFIEILRYSKFSFIGKYLSQILVQFQDDKDLQGPLNLSYIYLLIGITIPIAYDYITLNSQETNQISVVRYMGIVALGLGDAVASIVGGRFGTFKWKGSDKSVQGSAAFIIVNIASFFAIDYYLLNNYSSIYLPITNWENLFVITFISSILEGTSDLNDNFFLPIILPIGYELLNRFY
ncbi:hypothetical protein DFJ63DRAFT_144426 [Scheffersomyces coipomensis]|uniref:uncharacterized protein n=1 Tax=Scheffersomyces coipomensis TaxID=1788519 RepID=UPI00315CD22C